MTSTKMRDYWNAVEKELELAHLVAFEGCHKIYIAMDEIEAKWFRGREDYVVLEGTPSELYEQIVEWYEHSCPLKFVSSVVYDEENPNAGYTQLVPQDAEYESEPDDEEIGVEK